MMNIVHALHRLFRKTPLIVSIMLAKSLGRFENTEVTSHVFSAAVACGLSNGREVGRKIAEHGYLVSGCVIGLI
jgi:hypothetical protein